MKQALSGVAHMHGQRFLHRRLGPAKVLVRFETSGEPHTVISGFSHACLDFDGETNVLPINFVRWPPELLLGDVVFSVAADIWALGWTFGQLITMRPLWEGATNEEVMQGILRGLGSPRPEEIDILRGLPSFQTGVFEAVATMDRLPRPLGFAWADLGGASNEKVVSLMQSLLAMVPSRQA